MELRELIELGAIKAGSQRELASLLGLVPQDITGAKAGRRGLPIASCFLLAELLDLEPSRVIAASELVTEKKPERRAVLIPFVQRAACALLVVSAPLLVAPAQVSASVAGLALCIM